MGLAPGLPWARSADRVVTLTLDSSFFFFFFQVFRGWNEIHSLYSIHCKFEKSLEDLCNCSQDAMLISF